MALCAESPQFLGGRYGDGRVRAFLIRLPSWGRLAAAALAGLLSQTPALAGDEDAGETRKVDSEHLFGFTEGADIGWRGEQEFESTTVALFGKAGSYTATGTESAYRNVITDGFRVSFAALTDYHSIHDFPGAADRNGFDFGGLSAEFRWQILERSNSPVGLTLSAMPVWRRFDDLAGEHVASYSAVTEILFDAAPIPDKLFAAFNLIYEPSVARAGDSWEHESSLEVSTAASYAIAGGVFAGGEIRYLSRDANGFFRGRGVFAGPSLYWKFSETAAVKAAWSFQIADEIAAGPGLGNFERNQAVFLFVKNF